MSRARTIAIGAGVLVLGGAAIWAFQPEPVPVDMVTLAPAPMEVTVTAEGVTRVREPYLVTAPIAGRLARAPVEVGDAVVAGQTVVAVIEPVDPALLDVRSRAQAEAAVTEAEAAVRLAQTNFERAEEELAHAERQLARNRDLALRGTIPVRVLEESEAQATRARAALAGARSEREMRAATLARAEALLVGPAAALRNAPGSEACCLRLSAPQTGTVLELAGESARLVAPGEVLLSIGDLSDLEIEVDLLSRDAVTLAPGAPARIERWGGPDALPARVRRIDPRGFTRVSALGIEEQRVRVMLELEGPAAARAGLGDAFRVFASIVTWQADAALQVPISALFRHDGGWAVYRVDDGRAVLADVEIGRRTQTEAEVVSGLDTGTVVIAYPGARVQPGVRVVARAAR